MTNNTQLLVDSLVTEINQLHAKSVALDDTIRSDVLSKLEVCRHIGELLQTAQTDLKGPKFEAFAARLNFEQPMLRGYTGAQARGIQILLAIASRLRKTRRNVQGSLANGKIAPD